MEDSQIHRTDLESPPLKFPPIKKIIFGLGIPVLLLHMREEIIFYDFGTSAMTTPHMKQMYTNTSPFLHHNQ
jgi:hypothetical protein